MSEIKTNKKHIEQAILSTLSYFDIFKHPIKQEEILSFLAIPIDNFILKETLEELVYEHKIFHIECYYLLSKNPSLVEKRKEYEARAQQILPTAIKNGHLIRKFPFVKGVCISGSLSKNVMKADADVDYFIFASKNRLWISKLTLKIYKFIFQNNSREFFCINYFVSEDNLSIDERNTYTATEILTLIPIDCEDLYNEFKNANNWVHDFFPNFNKHQSINTTERLDKPISSKIMETLAFGYFGNLIDLSIRKFNQFRNKLKYRKFKKDKDYELMFRSTSNQIKVHNSNHQTNTLKSFKEKLNELNLE